MYQNILYAIENEIALITINRADRLNALNHATIQEIGKAVAVAANDSIVAGIIITGSGNKAFAAGADIKEFAGYNSEEAKRLSRDGQLVFKSIELCRKPVIAAVNGFALGGGCELAMSCHLRIASDNARFGQPEVKLGLTPGYAGTQRLVQLIGKSKALEFLLTADMVDSTTAFDLGLVNYVVSQEHLMAKCEEIIGKIKSNSPLATAAIIRCVDAYFTDGINGFETEIHEFGNCFGSVDFKEGVAAFLEKRKADFKRS